MPCIEIDLRPVEVPAGMSLIEAARYLNIEIPHYCYHPGLTVVGSCRMCQIELELNGRKSIALGCNTICADGMKITTTSETVQRLRRSVLEFYLQHHPLDCPICDDAGECDLQNYYMEHGLHDSRVALAEKRHKHKVHDVGPTVVLDSERCVLCSRCVRFCREIVGVDELGIFGHGNESELMNAPGKLLENDYAGNVVDLCPVGALTDKDFRFKRRVWYLKRTPSICTGCSRGCNIFVDADTSRMYHDPHRRIQRLKPRFNRGVNEWWMCDRGRYSYHRVDSPDRLRVPRTRTETNGAALSSETIIARAATRIKAVLAESGPRAIAVLASAKSSNEDLFLLKQLFADQLHIQHLDVNLSFEPVGKEDDILMRADLTPNRRGALEIGVKPWGGSGLGGDDIVTGAMDGDFDALIIIDHDLADHLSAKDQVRLKERCGYVLYLGTHDNRTVHMADDVLPIAMWAEREASYVNFQGRVQRTWKTFDPIGKAQCEWEIWQQLANALGFPASYACAMDVFDSIGQHVSAFKGLTWEGLGGSGHILNGVPEPADRKVQTARPLPAY